MAPGSDDLGIFAHYLSSTVTGNLRVRAVDSNDTRFQIRNHNTFANRFEYRGCQSQGFCRIDFLHGQRRKGGKFFNQYQIGRGRFTHCTMIDGKRTQNALILIFERNRPARMKISFLCKFQIRLPVRMMIDIGDDHRFTPPGSRTTGTDTLTNRQLIDCCIEIIRQTGCSTQLKTFCLLIQQQNGNQHIGIDRFEVLCNITQNDRQRLAGNDQIQCRLMCLPDQFGLFMFTDIQPGTDHLMRLTISIPDEPQFVENPDDSTIAVVKTVVMRQLTIAQQYRLTLQYLLTIIRI